MFTKSAKYHLGQIVRHKKHPFRGVVFDVDPEFSNTDEWYESIAYVSEQNLIKDHSGEPVGHPDVQDLFGPFQDGHYSIHFQMN